MHSSILTLEGSWYWEEASIESATETPSVQITYDYLINVEGNNFLVHPHDIPTLKKIIAQESPELHPITIRLISREGSIRQIYLNGKLIPATAGRDHLPSPSEGRAHPIERHDDLLSAILNTSGNMIEVLEAVRDNGGEIIDFKWVLVNNVAREILGDVVEERFTEQNPEAVESGLFEKYRGLIDGKQNESGILPPFEIHYHKYNPIKWFNTAVVRFGDGIVIASVDITERKNAELLQKRSMQILDSMNDACLELDSRGNIIFANRKVRDLLGRDKESMLFRNVWDVFPELVRTPTYTAIQIHGLEKKEYTQGECISEVFKKWISVRVTPTETGCIVLFHEIEDIINVRNNLEREHRRLKEAQAIGHIGNFEWDAATDKMYWSDEIYRIHNLKPQSLEITMEQVGDFLHPEDRDWVMQKIMNARKTPVKEKFIHRLLLKNGDVRYVIRNIESFADQQGKIIQFTGTIQDITEVKKAEEMLTKNLKTLIQAEKVAGMGSWDFDVESNKLYWSDGMYKIFGLEKGTPVQPEVYLQYAVEEDRTIARRITDKHLVNPEPFEDKIRIRTGEKMRTLKIKGTVLKSDNKKPLKVVGICVDVTAITESELALREQSHFISNIVKTVPDIINVVNLATGDLEYINRQPFGKEGFTLEDLQRLRFSEREKLIHPDDVEAVKNYYKTFISLPDDVANTVEYRARPYEGEWEWFRSHGKVFSRDNKGIPTHCVNVVQNITETKRSQDEVIRMKETLAQKAQARYEELFKSIDQGFAIIELITDEKGKPFDFLIHQTNPALEKITGFRNISGRRLRQLLADPLDDWFLTFGKIIRTQQPLRFTVKADELGGNWFNINAFPTGDASSNLVAILFNDITDRINQEEKLLDKQLKLDIAQKAARVGVWTYDLNLQQGMATSEWIELTGYPDASETWSLKRFLQLVHPDDAPSIKSAFDSARTQTGIEVEFRIDHPTRGLQWFLMRGSYIPSGNGANDSLMGSIIDITDRKAFESLKDQFIGIASHELKTPVTSIKAYAEILHEIYSKQNSESQESIMMGRMVNQVDRLVRLINDLLDTTKISAGGLVLEQQNFDLNELIQDRVEEIQHATSHKLIVKLHNIPPVYADKDLISQVLTNLVSNAIKYSPTASEVTITSELSDSHVIVRVRDLGIGLPEEHRDKIFDKFYRMYDTKHNTAQGLGLGLFIASEIIHKHHGTIGVQSKQGEGSEFYFTLPLKGIKD